MKIKLIYYFQYEKSFLIPYFLSAMFVLLSFTPKKQEFFYLILFIYFLNSGWFFRHFSCASFCFVFWSTARRKKYRRRIHLKSLYFVVVSDLIYLARGRNERTQKKTEKTKNNKITVKKSITKISSFFFHCLN